MARGPTAKRYAQAAFEIARETGRIDQWAENLEVAQQVLQDPTLKAYLEMPKVAFDGKMQVLRESLSSLEPLALNLVALLVSRDTIGLLPRIAVEYQRLVDDHMGRQRAEVITAVPLEDQQRERLGQRLLQVLGMEIVLTSRVDSEVLGGLVVRIGDKMIDGSTRGRLMAMRKSRSEVRV
ncbi:MAG: ATP synthase F1 subunit delta [Dehalococcoidia bacterium]